MYIIENENIERESNDFARNSCCGPTSETVSCCGTPKTESSCCSGTGPNAVNITTSNMKTITIDGKLIEVSPEDMNIVDVASRERIAIPAPCYRANRSQGCCNSCVVEIDGEEKFACSTIPEDGMDVVIDREDLKAIRKERLKEYQADIKNGNPCECSKSC